MNKSSKHFSPRLTITAMLMFFCFVLHAQHITVTGTVTDTSGEPAVGATVQVQGTKVGSVTNLDGQYSIQCSPNATLEFKYIGYETQTVAVHGRTSIDVALKSLSTDLNEVVVVGYGTQKKVNVTGAVSMVGSEVIENRPVANATQALQGAVPGLNFSPNNAGGELNNSMGIRIRGTGSIGNGSSDSPLVLIDGIEGDINALNPNDIESVSVLKDAASASIYGTRAAFGVILITTKSGKSGKVRVNYSGDLRFSTATQLPRMANSLEWANYMNVGSENAGAPHQFSDETVERIKKYMNGEYTDPKKPEYYGTIRSTGDSRWANYMGAFANTDWFKEHYKSNVPSTQHNLSMSGGNDKFNWLVSTGYLLQNGLIRHGHDELNRYTINGKMNAQLAEWARMEYSTKWTRKDYERPQYMSELFYHNIARRWPTSPVVDPNGHWMAEMEIEELENGGIHRTNDDQFTQQMKFIFTPLAGWNIYAEGALRVDNYKSTTSRIPIYNYDADNKPMLRDSGYGTVSNYTDYRWRENYYAVNVYTDYTRSFGPHNLKGLLGLNFERYNQDHVNGYGENLTMNERAFLSQTQKNFKASDGYWHRATAGYFGRLNYNYNDIYMLEFNMRYDGSSRFTSDKRWAWFPSVSLGWNVSEEPFFESLKKTVQQLKLRASYGLVGNDQVGQERFAYQAIVDLEKSPEFSTGYGSQSRKLKGPVFKRFENTNLTWEVGRKLNVGFDLTVKDIKLTVDVFREIRSNIFQKKGSIPNYFGTAKTEIYGNLAKVKNWGVDLAVDYGKTITKDLAVEFRGTLTFARNKVLEYDEAADTRPALRMVGKRLNSYWGYVANGLYIDEADIANSPKSTLGNIAIAPGDVKYADQPDQNGEYDGKIDANDRVQLGYPYVPEIVYGFGPSISYKKWDLSFFFQGQANVSLMMNDFEPFGTQSKRNVLQWIADDYWSKDNQNPNARYPRLTKYNNHNNMQSSSYWLRNAAFLRLKNFEVGYKFKYGRIYASASNLVTFSAFKLWDPEMGGGAGMSYPLQRTFNIGLQLTFK